MTDTVETFSIVLKCVCVFSLDLEKEKIARLFQDLKLDFDREKEIEDYTPPRFNLLLRENSDRKIVGLYLNGHFMTNIQHWSLYYCGKKAIKILNKKKYKDYLKVVYIDISEPTAESFHMRSHNMLDIVCNRHRIHDEDKENIQAFTHCSICKRLCIIKGDNNKIRYGICNTCWRNLSRRS